MDAPTSGGRGILARWRPLAWISISPDRQIDIVQSEGRDLAGPHAKPRQHHENGVIPPPYHGCPVATVENPLNLRGGQIGWKIRELPSPDGGHAVGKGKWVQPFAVQILEKCSKRPTHHLTDTRTPISGMR